MTAWTTLDAPPPAVRILRLFSRLNIGGPSLHVIDLSAGLNGLGYQTRLLVGHEDPGEGSLAEHAQERGVIVERLPALGRAIRPFADIRSVVAISRVLKEYKPHIVHTHTSKAGALGRIAAWLSGVPVVVHTYHGHVLQGYFGPLRSRAFVLIERLLGKRSQALVAVSEAVRKDLVRAGVAPAEKIRVIPLGLDLQPFQREVPRGALRRELGIRDDILLVGIVGRLVGIKDVPSFLAAAPLVRRHLPDARFIVAGDGPDRVALEAQTARMVLSDVVTFLGWRRDCPAIYADLDVVVNCSRNEGTPVALIEALAAGRPVVATRVGGNGDILAAGRYGRMCAAQDPQALAEAILDVLHHPAESARRAAEGRTSVLTRFTTARLIADVDRLYRELLPGGRQEAA